MAKKERLKNGLDMLFEDNFHDDVGGSDDEQGGQLPVTTLRISLIEPDKQQPRMKFDGQKLEELADNISQHGVLQPILVRPIGEESYKIVAGERRWRAARMAGLTEIPVVIRELSDIQAAQIALIENIQREDLDPIETAYAYKRLMEEFSMTQEQLSKSVGKSRASVANMVRLLKLPTEVQQKIRDKKISLGHAKLLCGAKDVDHVMMFAKFAENGMTVRDLERKMILSEGKVPTRKKSANKDTSDPFYKFAVETQMAFKQMYGIDVKVEKNGEYDYCVKFLFDNENALKDMVETLSNNLD